MRVLRYARLVRESRICTRRRDSRGLLLGYPDYLPTRTGELERAMAERGGCVGPGGVACALGVVGTRTVRKTNNEVTLRRRANQSDQPRAHAKATAREPK
eukprot:5370929-Pyramimonas_sp.AAC.2